MGHLESVVSGTREDTGHLDELAVHRVEGPKSGEYATDP